MLQNIQALRFIAALWVLLYHMQPPITPFRLALLPDAVLQLGFAGVDLFFVISGYIMAETTRSLPSGARSAAHFALRRLGRIYIGWWPFFALYAVVQFERLRPEVDLVGSFFLWPQGLQAYLVPITWTLSFELYFYCAIALLVAWNRSRAGRVLAVAGVALAAWNIWAHCQGLYDPANEGAAKDSLLLPFYLSPLVLEFIGGFLLSEWLHRRTSPSPMLWAITAAALLWVAHLYQSSGALHASGMAGFFHVGERAVLLGGFSIALVAMAVALERRGFIASVPLQRLGDASYSIYLAHITVLNAAAKALGKWPSLANLPNAAWALGCIATTLACAWLLHRWYERPTNDWLKARLARPA